MVATFLSQWSLISRPRLINGLWRRLFYAVFAWPGRRLLLTAFGDSGGLWGHLVDTVLPTYVINTLLLMGGVGGVAIVFGVSSAWVISRYDFAGRAMLEWMLLLPAAYLPILSPIAIPIFSNMPVRFNQRFERLLDGKAHAIIIFLKFAQLAGQY